MTNTIQTRTLLIDIANDFQNDYLSTERYAECNGLTKEEAWSLIELAQKVRSHAHPE